MLVLKLGYVPLSLTFEEQKSWVQFSFNEKITEHKHAYSSKMNITVHILVVSPCLFQKSKDSKKGPVVILSITYRGVKFIDAATKVQKLYGCLHGLN